MVYSEAIPLKYHGLWISSTDSGELRFGMNQLIGSCQSWPWDLKPGTSEATRKALQRFHNRAYWQGAAKCQYTVHMLIKAMKHLGNCLDIFERKEEFAFDGAPMERAAVFFSAVDDVPYHLDALLAYLRILADCVAFAIPFFYETRQSIANCSFRDQRKWFTRTEPGFDPEYGAVLKEKTGWFDKLAGKQPKGIRDLAFHQYATYQLGRTTDEAGVPKAGVYQVTPGGIQGPSLTQTIPSILGSFFEYLDATYGLFGNRVFQELSPPIIASLEERSVFLTLRGQDLQQRYRLWPRIQAAGDGILRSTS